MSLTESVLMWIVSFLIFLILLYCCYKVSYKLGIKKALYRTTYILLSIIFAFAITPFVNNELFQMDLTQFNIVLTYKDQSFTTLIDYIEEVFAHSDFLNDLYVYFPSLKDLFMDFPQVVLAPVTYVLLFILFMIIWLPLYLYLSYKRDRRVLYDREDKKSHRIWAGILGAIQMVFIVSVILSPVNGINRIYQQATNDTLDEEYDSLCDGNELFSQYKNYCDIIEAYDSTIFATIGSKYSLSNYIFNSLTRITHDNGYTTLTEEASMIVKSGIVLNQSGLLNIVMDDGETIPVPLILEKDLDEKDIDIIVETLRNSQYSDELLIELETLTYNTLDNLIYELSGERVPLNMSLTQEETIEEIKIVLHAIPTLVNTTLINDLIKVRNIVYHYTNEVPENRKDDKTMFAFLGNMLDQVNIDDFELLCEYLFESKIVNNVLPRVLDKVFGEFGFNLTLYEGDILDFFYSAVDFARLIKRYHPETFQSLIKQLNDEEMMMLGEIFNYLTYSNEMVGFVHFLLEEIFSTFEGGYALSEFFKVDDWTTEVYVLRDVLAVVDGILNEEDEIDADLIIKLWNNKESKLAEAMRITLKRNTNYLIKELVKSLDK